MKKTITSLFCILAVTALSACSSQADKPSQAEQETMSETESGSSPAQWKTEGFATPGETDTDTSLWAGEYLPWESQDNAGSAANSLIRLDYGVCGNLFWHFGTESRTDGLVQHGPEGKYILEIYDTTRKEYTVKRFSPEELGLENELGFLDGMDLIDRDHYMFRWLEYEQDQDDMYRQTADKMVYTNLAGEIHITDLWETYLENGIEQEELTILPLVQSLNCRCDGKGNTYTMTQKGSGGFTFYLFDPNGLLLLKHGEDRLQMTVEPLRTPDGELILPVYNSAEKIYEFLWADTAAGELRSIGQMEASSTSIAQMYGMLGDEIYYRRQAGEENSIISWNIKDGRRVQVFDFKAAGIGIGFQTLLALQEGQTPVLRLTKTGTGGQTDWLTTLTAEKPADDGIIRVADLTQNEFASSSETIVKCTALASIENPNFRYEYEDASAQEIRDRILAELSQGQGPDLLFVSREDMYLLEEKGLLLDMEDLLPGELREKLLPGALELGTIDGTLFGMPATVKAETIMIAGDTWPEDTWSLEDVTSLMENGSLKAAFYSLAMNAAYSSPPVTVLDLVKYSLGESSLIDWTDRKSLFNGDGFLRLLKATQKDIHDTFPESETWLNEGTHLIACEFSHESFYDDFFTHMEAESGKLIGYPTSGSCGNYLVTDGILVINANTARREAASCFLETLLGEELQSKELKNAIGLSVRKISPEDELDQDIVSGKIFYKGREMTVFQDGTTPLHRAAAFLEGCVAPQPVSPQIYNILYEELFAMYAENKSPEATADIINSRIQLYLDEGN